MKVRLSAYNENWVIQFQQEAQRMREIFGEEIVRIEHFGSTAVKGMKAKPVIDMMCLVKNIIKVDAMNDKLISLGYDVAGEWGIEGRRLFRKGGENRTHHIHFYQEGHPEIDRHLIFRDYLRAHPQKVDEYSAFKEGLAQQYKETKEYSPAKKKFVSEMELKALLWFVNKK
ncbi:GrpB family protein [Mesobacillus maritimus]|uniref:GrpB family protein n=1 Tax=Mesobacillus maritimus TaxID=1643336 RepID=UPI00203D2F46|nr:GrpB family protein [Mesobacillus maritimus]MCM3586695.1 GrpB family protein [Mesobacillus maritimus]MCM3668551.1 GrpB family protein [Mesobacillus maritimus]